MEATRTERVAQNKFDLYYLECPCGNQWNQVHTPPQVMFQCLLCGKVETAVTVAERFWKKRESEASVDEYWESKGL